MLDREDALIELGRLRNRQVARLLTFLGDTPEYLSSAIKRSYTMFADDIAENIINSDSIEYHNGDHSHKRD